MEAASAWFGAMIGDNSIGVYGLTCCTPTLFPVLQFKENIKPKYLFHSVINILSWQNQSIDCPVAYESGGTTMGAYFIGTIFQSEAADTSFAPGSARPWSKTLSHFHVGATAGAAPHWQIDTTFGFLGQMPVSMHCWGSEEPRTAECSTWSPQSPVRGWWKQCFSARSSKTLCWVHKLSFPRACVC